MYNTKTITHLSLCSGYEGIGLGLRRVLPNLREIAYVEREGFPIANLVAKMQEGALDAAPVFTDVKTFPYGKFCGLVDILSGGFPCQPFSNAGKREGVEDPRHLFPYIRDGIAECRPRLVFLENVEGILSSKTADGESVLKYVLGELEDLDYCATAGIFSASEVGAPHQRKRVFILGLENPNNNPTRDLSGKASRQTRREPSNQQINGKGCSIWSNPTSAELGNAECTRLEGHTGTVQETSRWHQPLRPVAPPSFQQHEWEQPRTQPKLGRTAHGSSSRVDRLRLLGNGVVPATAAKAFVTLLNKLL